MSKLKSSKKVISFIMTLLMILGIGIPQTSFAADDKVIALDVIVDKDNLKVGEEFTYTILYSYSSNIGDFVGEEIILSLPEPLEFVSFLESVDVSSHAITAALPGSGDPGIIISMKDLPSGTTGFIKVAARFKPGSINETTSRAGILTNNPSATPTASAIVPVVTATVDSTWTWTLTKDRVLPNASITPAYGGDVTYRISVRGNDLIGGFPIKNAIITDTLPLGSEFVSATGSYTASPSALSPSSLEWTIPVLSPGALTTFDVTVNYPSDYATNTAVNLVDMSGDRDGYPGSTKTASNSHGITAPGPSVSPVTKWSRQSDDRYAIGQNVVFYVGGYNNAGNVPIDEIEIVDTIPDGIDLQSVTIGDADSVYYSTYQDPDNFVVWTTPSSLPLGLGTDHIKKVKWTVNNVQVGFVGEPLRLSGQVLGQYRESPLSPAAVAQGESITNTVTLTATEGGVALTSSTAIKTITVGTSGLMELPWLELTKYADAPPTVNKKVDKGDTVTYTIRLKNNDYATGDLVMSGGQTITFNDLPDTIMKNYTYVSLSGTASSLGAITGSGTSDGAVGITATAVEWTWTDGMLKPGQYIDITYTTYVDDDALVGAYYNTATATTSGIFLDDRTAELSATAKVFVRFSGSLKSSKGIKGHEDLVFQYPSPTAIVTDTFPGGTVRYQLKVNNGDSNGPITNVVMIDKFPFIGDRGVIVPFTRDSEWSPYLVNIVTGKDGTALTSAATVYYSTSANPDVSKLRNPLGTDTGWTLTPPDPITDAKAIKIEFGNTVFEPNGEPIYVEWDMRVPVSFSAGDYGKIANNSFAYGATYSDENASGDAIQLPFLPAEPVKVGAKLTTASALKYAIGDFIWEDTNKDGVQGVSEAGINGITVNLYEDGNPSPIAFTITANNLVGKSGYYNFPNLDPGLYHVEFVMPTDYFITNPKTTDDALDSDFIVYDSVTRKYRASVTLGAVDYIDLDAGIYKLGSIGDYIFNDRNLSHTNNSGDVAVSGASVKLYLVSTGGITVAATYWDGTSFVPTPTIITNSTGKYEFDGLDPGEYVVEFTMPNDDFKFVNYQQGSDRTIDSDVLSSSTASGVTVGWTDNVVLESGEDRTDIDAGIYLGQIGDRVWHDKNGNGIQDDTSSNISGVTVRLYAADGVTPATNAYGVTVSNVTTNSSGLYYFNDLGAGSYVVEFVKPSGYSIFTFMNTTGASVDSDANRTNGKTSTIVLAPGERNLTVDAGLYSFASLGDKVFNDRNLNGIQDTGDIPVSGASVTLYRVTAGGVTIPALYWNGASYVAVPSQTTTDSGLYKFTNLDPGDYLVEYTVPNAQSRFVAYATGSNTNIDSNVQTSSGSVGWSNVVSLTSGQNRTDVDAGVYFGRIGNLVWLDENANGIQDIGEAGISGVTVQLYKADGTTPAVDAFGNTVADVLTDASGNYYFNDLGADTYVVKFVAPAGSGYVITRKNTTTSALDSDADQVTALSSTVTLLAGAQDLTVDCGLYKFVSIGDFVFNDLDANGVQNPGETGVTGVSVTLLKADGVTRATYWDGSEVADIITTGSGFYQFDGLDPGQYRLQFKTTDPDFMATYPNVGDDVLDSDGISTTANYSVVLTGTYTLVSNGSNLTVDQGFFIMSPDIDIEKTVYEGNNSGAGIGTHLIARVSGTALTYMFKITNTGNTCLDDIVVTDAALGITLGAMTIKSGSLPLVPGATLVAYYETTLTTDLVNIVDATGTPVYDTTGTAIPGMTKPTDSDTAEARAVTPGLSIVKMVYDGHDSGAQAGNKKLTGAIGDNITYVFTIINTSDTFLKDITVTDNAISIGGVYLTNGGMTLKAGYDDTVPLAINDTLVYYYETTLTGNLFNTVSVIGTPCNSSGVEYAGAPKPTDADSAEVELQSSIGDMVWYDLDGNGLMNGSETGVPGVVVRLYNGGILVEQTTTNALGWYLFDELPSGTYTVIVVPGSELDGYAQTYDLDGVLDNQTSIVLGTNTSLLTADFGYEPTPHLTLTKTVDKAFVRPGEMVVYSLTVLNDGKTDLENIRVSDTAVGINITIPTLASNASITTTVAFVIPVGAPLAPWVNIADAWSSTTAIVTDDAITTVRIPSSPTPIVPIVTPPVITSPAVCSPVGPGGGGTVDTKVDTPVGGTIPGTGGTVVTPPDHGTVAVDDKGEWIYTPNSGFVGTDSFVIVTACNEGITSGYEIVVNVLEKDNEGLPKTGGVDQGLLYSIGALLMLLGFILLRRQSYNAFKWRRDRF
jgi:uncharacterized repeat protein (TIGR01451 family)/LPXTG-motif cell wall-anchored protein